MIRLRVCGAVLAWAAVVCSGIVSAGDASTPWPSLTRQLAQARAIPGSALDRLIRGNQDFSLLRPAEASDLIGIPVWLRVVWRKAHPEGEFPGSDPTGGYPRVLKDVFIWMVNHQDLVPPPQRNSSSGKVDPLATVVGTNLRISGAQTSPRSESDIRIDFFDPTKILSASNEIVAGGSQAQFSSTDGGVTWGQADLPLGTDAFFSDPTVEWSSDGTAWSGTLGINNTGNQLHLRSFQSADSGATWALEATVSGAQRAVDKPLEWVDHSAASPFKDQAYFIWHNGRPVFMNRRTAGPAGTWGATPIQVSAGETTGTGIGGDVTANSAGDVFGFWPDTGSSGLYMAKSTDGGATFAAPVTIGSSFDSYDIGVPSFASRRALIYTSGGAYRSSVPAKDNVYVAWADLSGEVGCTAPNNEPGTSINSSCKTRIWFARSTDGGATWGPKAMVNNPASRNDQYNQRLAVDETTGAIGLMYYDTVGDPLTPPGCTNNCTGGRLKTDVWYQSSFDDGVTWSAPVLITTAMTDETAAGADAGNQYGDYNGLSGYAGVFFPSWTDRRNNASEEIWTAKITDSCARPDATLTSPSGVVANSTGNTASVPVTAGATYAWSIVNGTITAGAGTNAIVFSAGVSGTVDLSVTVTLTGCSSNSQVSIPIVAVGTALKFFTIVPCRLIDTRRPNGTYGGPALQGGTTRDFPLAGQCALPADAVAASGNVTVVNPTARGDLRIFPTGTPVPNASAINFNAGRTRANNVLVPLTGVPLGSMTVQTDIVGGSTHFLFDVNGYFRFIAN